ncbi:MAG: hypothetical protein IKD00_03155 [Candidatus Methanomethylophilaceae archaeon]|nr:hypothetical protein [Candidatus Methanomethylophilaceae archaeon]
MQVNYTATFVSAQKTSSLSNMTDYTRDMVRPDAVNEQKLPEPMHDLVKSRNIHQYCTGFFMNLPVPVMFEKRLTGFRIIPDPSFTMPVLRF